MDFMKIVVQSNYAEWFKEEFIVYPEGKWTFIDEHRNERYDEVFPSIQEWWIWNSNKVMQKMEERGLESSHFTITAIDPYNDSIIEEEDGYYITTDRWEHMKRELKEE
jgi:hypothetical protein